MNLVVGSDLTTGVASLAKPISNIIGTEAYYF
jgi:hypothetical protein